MARFLGGFRTVQSTLGSWLELGGLNLRFLKTLGLLGVGVALSGCMSPSVAATVNGNTITTASLLSEVNAVTSNQAFVKQLESSQRVFGQGSNTYDLTFVDEVLNRRISMDLIDQKAKSLHIKLSSQDIALGRIDAEQTFGGSSVFREFPKAYQAQLIRDSAMLDAVEASLVGVNVSLPALRAYYKSNPSQFTSICSSQILVGTQYQANSIYGQVKAGANFAALAKADSGDPNTAANGGAVGCGTYSNYVSALGSQYAAVVKDLAPNSVAMPVHLATGWSIIEVTSRTSPPFDQLTPQIRAAILGSKGQAAITGYVNGALKSARITVNARYGRITASSSGVGVAPFAPLAASRVVIFKPSAG